MELYLCEKPSVGRALAHIVNAREKEDGYLHDGNNICVTWAIGHLLQLKEPGDYKEEWNNWTLESLPILPEAIELKVSPKLKKQYGIVEKLIQKATKIFICTDIDREGESIAREIMDSAGYWGHAVRVPLNANDAKSIRNALETAYDAELSYPQYLAQIARSRGDWLVGMNISRLASLTAEAAGSNDSRLPAGRVLTSMVALVCRRDSERANFEAHTYFNIALDARFAGGSLSAKWLPSGQLDEGRRCISGSHAQNVADRLNGAQAEVTKKSVRNASEKPPLPFDMTSLLQYCSNRWGYSPAQTLSYAQELYEKHTAITYPRTDSKFLPESQRSEVPQLLRALADGDPSLREHVAQADTEKKVSAYNTDKIDAHHGIIPTTRVIDFKGLPEHCRNVFDAVRLRFLALFLPKFEYEKTIVTLKCQNELFNASGTVTKALGWKALYNGDDSIAKPADDDEENDSDANHPLPFVEEGASGSVAAVDLSSQETQPPKAFTDATLLAAMQRISRYVQEEDLKRILDEKAGIGQEGTRPQIIENAIQYDYLNRKKRTITATPKAFAMLTLVPPAMTSAGMTAGWELQLNRIAAGELSLDEFEKMIRNWVAGLVEQGKERVSNGDLVSIRKEFNGIGWDPEDCFECGARMSRRKGSEGYFWACGNVEECGATFNDNRGKPQKPVEQPDSAPTCSECGSIMKLRKRTKKKSKRASTPFFWGCSGYPECTHITPYT